VKRLADMLASALPHHRDDWRVQGSSVEVTLGAQVRRHRVHFARRGEEYVFTSLVTNVRRSGARRCERALLAWRRNASQDLVTFGIDAHDRLIGQIVHRADTLDPSELGFLITTLARECDSLEYYLTGHDMR